MDIGDAGTIFSPTFNRSAKVKGHDERLTAEVGVLLLR